MQYLFVGEERSKLAKKMGVTWLDGRLAAKQLFDALRYCGIDPLKQEYCNLFERGGKSKVNNFNGVIVGMGNKVSRGLTQLGIPHLKIVHPASRGKIRLKENYLNHVKLVLCP